jgi:hypothetical protein
MALDLFLDYFRVKSGLLVQFMVKKKLKQVSWSTWSG